MKYLGIDPGLNGALAVYTPDPLLLEVMDMPTLLVANAAGKKKHRLDLAALSSCININMRRDAPIALAVCEDPNAMPEQGVVSSFNFGYTCGAAHAMLAAHAIPYRLVKPSVWKRAMGLTADKDATRFIASQRFPAFAHLWARKKDDGRAEAALLALYASTLT